MSRYEALGPWRETGLIASVELSELWCTAENSRHAGVEKRVLVQPRRAIFYVSCATHHRVASHYSVDRDPRPSNSTPRCNTSPHDNFNSTHLPAHNPDLCASRRNAEVLLIYPSPVGRRRPGTIQGAHGPEIHPRHCHYTNRQTYNSHSRRRKVSLPNSAASLPSDSDELTLYRSSLGGTHSHNRTRQPPDNGAGQSGNLTSFNRAHRHRFRRHRVFGEIYRQQTGWVSRRSGDYWTNAELRI